jgi:hypothetical protein
MVTKGGYTMARSAFSRTLAVLEVIVKDEVDEDAAEIVQQAVSAIEEAEKATGKRATDLF